VRYSVRGTSARSTIKALASVTLASILIQACAAAATPAPTPGPTAVATPAGTPEPAIKILIGTGADPSYGVLHVVVDGGFLKKQGLEGEYKIFDAGGSSVEGASAGTLHVGGASEFTSIRLFSGGANIVFVTAGLTSKTNGGLGVAPGINKPEDLNGKSVAIVKGANSEFFQKLYFQKHNLSESQIKVLNVAAPDMVPAMSRGDIAGMFIFEPWLTRMKDTVPGSKILNYYGDDNVYDFRWGYSFNKDFVTKTPQTAAKVLKAIIEATDYVNTNADAAADIVSKALRQPKGDVAATMKLFKFDIHLLQDDRTWYTNQVVPFMVQAAIIKQPPDAKAMIDQMLDPTLLKSVDPTRTDIK
jgi:ABC-type nitrate/sulfonate/bicarbonate transport system substrate-binding protein